MKPLPLLAAALAAFISLGSTARAQQECPRCPSATPAQTRCPARTLDECPLTGCGAWDQQLNCRKNLTCDPENGQVKEYTLDHIRNLKYPREWLVGKDRKSLVELGEGWQVRVSARLHQVKPGDPDSAYCRLNLETDTHLSLVSDDDLFLKHDQREAMSVTANITPRVRILHKKWTRENLYALMSYADGGALYVRITGLLLLDTGHINAPLVRATDWEIHPVLQIEVCTTRSCAQEDRWEKLDESRIPKPKWKPQSRPGRQDPRTRGDEDEDDSLVSPGGRRVKPPYRGRSLGRGGRRRGRR